MLSRATKQLALRRQLATRYSSSSAPAQATLLGSSSASSPSPPPPPPAAQAAAPLRPQPFIPKPLSRSYQIASLQKAAHALTASGSSTTILLTTTGGATSHTLTVPNLFLRDASVHPSHVHPSSRQKLFRTTDVPLEGEVVGYGVHEIAGEEHLVMEWTTAVEGVEKKAAKLSVTPLSLLVGLVKGKGDGLPPAPRTWDRAELDERVANVDYAAYAKEDKVLLRTLDALLQDGIVFLEGVPVAEKEGQVTPELRKVVERVASVRRTWYGDLFDVKAEQGSKNIAYTNLDLGLHMDLTHFESPPRYQFLHSLLNSGVTGGTSYFVDSFAVVSSLLQHHPSAFDTLTTEPLLFSYTSDTHSTRFIRPVIELVEGSKSRVHAVNYSPPFQGPLVLERIARGGAETTSLDEERLAELHEALRLFAEACDAPENRFERQLVPGDCVVFDNRRILHARTAFEWTEGEGAEARGRWLKGAYCDGDEVKSKWRVLQAKREKGTLR